LSGDLRRDLRCADEPFPDWSIAGRGAGIRRSRRAKRHLKDALWLQDGSQPPERVGMAPGDRMPAEAALKNEGSGSERRALERCAAVAESHEVREATWRRPDAWCASPQRRTGSQLRCRSVCQRKSSIGSPTGSSALGAEAVLGTVSELP